VVQLVEWVPSKNEVLSSKAVLPKKKRLSQIYIKDILMKTLISTSSDLKGVLEGLFQIKMKNIGQQHEKIRLSLVTKLCREIQNTEML
jgi:hypothetical protein